MNSFANSLFTLLFSGARSLIQQVWTSAAEGRYSGFLAWLGDHWLWVALALCLLGTAVDFLIWLIRWRPYLVWRTKWRRFKAFLRGERSETSDARRFERGYQGGVSLELNQQEAENRPLEAWVQPEEWQQPPEASFQQPEPSVFAQAEQAPAVQPPAVQPAENPGRPRRFSPQKEYELPPVDPVSGSYSTRGTDLPAARRKRRSDKYDRKRSAWRENLRNRVIGDDEGMLDGLPPVVDKEEAFHAPVYPVQADQSNAGWQQPRVFKQPDGK